MRNFNQDFKDVLIDNFENNINVMKDTIKYFGIPFKDY